ncbi:MAG TPA: redoxin domain-containing protein [Anaerolineales bacterium]|nr:redoxin domain-containing protein [Anaerolineales bacterium]
MRKVSWLLTFLLFALLGLAGCASSDETANLAVGDPAPEFRLPSAAGQEVALADFVGERPVLLYFHMAMG